MSLFSLVYIILCNIFDSMKIINIIVLCLIFCLSGCVSDVEKGNKKIEIGLDLLEKSKPFEAITEFNKALTYQPENALIYYYLCNSYVELNQIEEAINAYAKAVTHNLTNMNWTEAFLEMHKQLKISYPFGDWKRIDWEALFSKYSVQISMAQANNNSTAYQLALREYIYSIPDSHVYIESEKMDSLINQNLDGSLGFTIIGLDNNKIIINNIDEKGSAFKAGMKWGAEILTWDEKPITTALDNTSVLWAFPIPSTLEVKKLEQFRLLPFSPKGTEVKITFKNPDTEEVKSVTLISGIGKYSYNCEQTSLQGYFSKFDSAFSSDIHTEILENDIGYLWIRDEKSYDILPKVQEAMDNFKTNEIKGLILDVRQNYGGIPEVVAELTGYFFNKTSFYEHSTWYNPINKKFEISDTIQLKPKSPYLDIPIVVLISERCMSSGEGIPCSLKKRPNTTVLGFYGTSGIFGSMIREHNIIMPESVYIGYPLGQSLNEDKVVQLDSDFSLNGGVVPDIRVPMNYQNAYSSFVEKKDVLMEEAIKILLKE